MTQSFNFQGFWWLPQNSDRTFSGTLEYDLDNRRIELAITGKLEDVNYFKENSTEFIIGNNTNGKEVTLFRCLLFSSKESSSGIWIAKFSIAVVFVGAHLSNIGELNFNSIQGKFANFHEWISPPSMQWDSSQESIVKFEYNRPDNIEFPIGTNLTGKFSFGYKVPFSTSKFEIEEYVSLGVYADERISFKDLYTRLITFRNFLSLSQYNNVSVTSIHLKSENIFQEHSREKKTLKSIDVFLFGSWPKNPKPMHQREMLFNYNGIKSNFPSIIRKWYEIEDKLAPSIAFFVDSVSKDRILTENSFLNIAQAVETFHRRFRNNLVLPKDEYEKKKRDIVGAVPIEHKDWLKDKLNFANELTLHQRLEQMLLEFSNQTLNTVIKNRIEFIRDIKNSRNYYTHYDSKLKTKAKSGEELYHLTEKLKILLACAILKEIGFTSEQIETLLKDKEWTLFNHIL